MIQIINKSDCAGCSACGQVCAKKAITFLQDSEGFQYPNVNTALCNDCGLCEKVCPVLAYRLKPKEGNPTVYAAKHKQHDVLLSSSSGGIFVALAHWIISQGGVVFGVCYDSDFNVVHQKAETIEECEKFRGSKYVQSNLGNTFLEIRKLLREERLVLFTGVPCQVAGLKLFLRKEHHNLYTADLICHGVPSPQLFSEFISLIQRKEKLSYINMRWKGEWDSSRSKIFYTNGRVFEYPIWRPLFFRGAIKRPSCYQCEFTHYNRAGDVTIADYWGIKKSHPSFYDSRGISLILVNTEKGAMFFKQVRIEMEVIPSDLIKCLQPRLISPPPIPSDREQFWNDYHKRGFEFIAKKYAQHGFLNQLIVASKIRIKKILRR